MSFKSEFMKKIKEYIPEEVSENIKKNGGIMNTVVAMSAKEYGVKEYKKKSDKKYMYLKGPSLSTSFGANVLRSKRDIANNKYEICDENGNIKFETKEIVGVLTEVYNAKNEKIGYIKNIISFLLPLGNPFEFEYDASKCHVFKGKDILCKLKRYKQFGTRFYSGYNGSIGISNDANKKITIKNKEKKIATLHILPYKLSKTIENKYIIEYDEEKDEKTIALIAIGLSIIGLDNRDYAE